MNKVLFLFISTCFLSISLAGLAQTEKGNILLGGNAGIQFNTPFYISLNPDLGVFIKEKLAIGGSLPFYFSSNSRNDHVSYSLGLNPFIRYYLGKSKVQYFLMGSVGFINTWYNYEDSFSRERIRNNYATWTMGAGVGAVYFLTQQIGLEAALVYRRNNLYFNGDRNTPENRVNLNFGFQIYLPSGN